MICADQIAAFFRQSDGSYYFARWTHPIAPVVFGVDDTALPVLKGAAGAQNITRNARA